LKDQNILLEVKNLVTEFQTEDEVVKAVNNISFTLNRGETIGVVGESGSGKSVTSLSVMRLIPDPPGRITGGEIIFHKENGEKIDLTKASEVEMRGLRGNDIAMIFQEPMTSLNPVYTCGNQVAEAIILHQKVSKNEAKKKTIALFKQVELPRPEAMFDAYPHQISGGQKQRVMIAMAMSCQPKILIADEPTTALDVTVQNTILHLMNQLQREQDMGILFITHDLGVIAELADKVVVMYKGKIVEQGSVWDVFSSPRHPYTKGLLACRPPMNKRLHWLPTIKDFMQFDVEGDLQEVDKSVEQVVSKLLISKEERRKRHKAMYAHEPVLKVKGLRTYFPLEKNIFGNVTKVVKAVDDVTFDVYPGETLGLVGESGCGKTTLGRTILRLVNNNGGQIIYNGIDLGTLSSKELRNYRKDMQIVFQDPYSSLNPRLTVGEAIMEPMRVHNILSSEEEQMNRVVELLVRVNMGKEHFYRYPHEFSGGQRQRICIARALALKDEFNFTYIFISHDLSVVKFMADRMIVMNQGKIEEMGDADEIYNNPQSEYTKGLINAIPKGELADIKAVQASKQKNLVVE